MKQLWIAVILAGFFPISLLAETSDNIAEDGYTKLLVQSESSDGNVVFADSSPALHSISVTGNVRHENASKKFGLTSIYFDGTSDYFSLGTHSDWDFGTNDFTIDCYVRFQSNGSSSVSKTQHVFTTKYNTNALQGGIQLYLKGTDGYKWCMDINGTQVTGNSAPIFGNWNHVAIVRYQNVITLYAGGSSVASTPYSGAISGGDLRIAHHLDTANDYRYFEGYLEEFRISKGIARWTGNFTKTASPYYYLSSPTLSNPVAGNAQAQLSWTAVTGAVAYKVKYGTTSGNYPNTVDVSSGTSTTISNLTNGTPYYFVVTACDASSAPVQSAPSSEKTATPVAPPAAPTLSSATGGASQVTLNWTAISGATAYRIKYGAATGSYPTVVEAGSGTSFTVTGLSNNTSYYFVVTAYNGVGESPVSNEENAMPFIEGTWIQNQTSVFFNTGNVGIGTQNPQTALAVNGTITAKEVRVSTSGWADFVFAPNYALKSLPEVETFVNQEGHLPGFPSEQQLVEGGIPVSEMLKLQTQKIEELTLYVISLQKKLDTLEKQNARSNNQ